jgi:hypothetical protein
MCLLLALLPELERRPQLRLPQRYTDTGLERSRYKKVGEFTSHKPYREAGRSSKRCYVVVFGQVIVYYVTQFGY